MASLRTHMKYVGEADVIVWHEGDLTHEDADALDGAANVRFCLLAPAREFKCSAPRRFRVPEYTSR